MDLLSLDSEIVRDPRVGLVCAGPVVGKLGGTAVISALAWSEPRKPDAVECALASAPSFNLFPLILVLILSFCFLSFSFLSFCFLSFSFLSFPFLRIDDDLMM